MMLFERIKYLMKQKPQMGIEKWAEVASITQSLGLAYQSP